MKWIILTIILTFICYALIVAASDADRDAYEMYEKWKEKQTERSE